MIIYRIQNKDKRGPYTSTANSLVMECNVKPSKHPLPEDDLQLSRNMQIRGLNHYSVPSYLNFGFGSLKQARRWVYKYSLCESLRKRGFFLYQFELHPDDVIVGDYQVAFDSELAQESHQTKLGLMEELWRKRKS